MARLRRGQLPDPDRDLVEVTQRLPELAADLRWEITAGSITNGTLLLSLTVVPSSSAPEGPREQGAAVAWIQLEPESALELGGFHVLDPTFNEQGLGLRAVRLEADGRYTAVGLRAVATATSPSAKPELLHLSGFEGLSIFLLEEAESPFLVLGNNGQAFEGPLYPDFDPARVYPVPPAMGHRMTSATRGRNGSVFASADGGLLLERTAPRVWKSYGLAWPAEVAACLGTTTRCGRWQASREMDWAVAAPNGGGFLNGSEHCNAVFWRSEFDPCASAVPLEDAPFRHERNQGIQSMVEFEGRVFLGRMPASVYELEFTDEED